ncbi:arylsulfatase [Nocardia neocaledoniensis NBRC 108232]|uniref:Arylsulfatase n=1 Tax=Nocardia neocaledoniensis TaxID=236511 RepID=A0A317NZ45_9NOCA|nr:arylsulfatase [Nocardia neocaledoniensis]PWV79218.1 arylsulfatase [Nocardia neocaledoniensis]GEM34956.1 arylsulfatase [Nocardia neocaledoniensis NBRC 108232]
MPVPSHARGYESFGGSVGRTAADSTPEWTAPPTAPRGAPNIVVVLVDDMGYSDIGPFGSEIETPTLDRLAANGVRLSNYHTTPLCSPSRAALLTGINSHRAGFGFVANTDPGYPGLRLELADDVLTLPEILRANGYATYAVGKWHLVRDATMNPAAHRDSWPTQRGFDRYYGSLEGLNSFYYPNQLVSDSSVVDVEEYPEGYYLTDDLTDKALSYIKDLRAHDATKPFFLYFAHVAMHGPLQAKAADQAKYRGKYAEGWDELRRRRFAEQLAQGLFPPGTEQKPRNTEPGYEAAEWDSLSADEQRRYAKYMEVYAGMVDSIDQSLGRIVDLLDELGELDDTIIVFTSDNGGTAEGGPEGTRSYFAEFAHIDDPDWIGDVPHDEDLIGTAKLGVHYPRGWGQASNTPFRFYKGQTFAGGVRVPLVVSWPKGLPRGEGDGGIRHEYAYVTDLAPTLLDLAGLDRPSVRNGLPAKDFDGVSAAALLRDPAAPTAHTEQYSEMTGHRGYYRDGWKLLSLHERDADIDAPNWQLFDVRADPTELHDLSDRYPDKAAELAAAWDESAWANTVFPLLTRADLFRRRPEEARFAAPVRLLPGTPTLERYRSQRLIAYRDFTITADLSRSRPAGLGDLAPAHAGYLPGDEGVLVAHGDPLGGYLLYIEDGEVVFGLNSYGRYDSIGVPLPAGTREITVRATVRPRLRWDFVVEVDGTPLAELTDQVQLVGMAPWTGISVGVDARGPVSWDLRERRGPFRYTGALRAVTYTPGPIQVPTTTIDAVEREAEYVAE